ncbi:GNAT family N-acetyltransferase [Maricaulis sp.]|uniref:GNAT family N-acetyltransferase n=1 Tax=Maricaulis sp. TaxID=1486257 RepID=UPI003A8F3EB4
MSALRIERTGPDSAGRMSDVHAVCFQPFWSAGEIAAMMQMPTTLGLLARKGDAVVGMALCRIAADEAELLTIGVVPEQRGQGVGEQILARGETEAASRGAGRMFLEVSTLNAAGKSLYLKSGYAQIGCRRGYYGDGSDALVLEKTLFGDGQGSGSKLITPLSE